MNFNTELLKNKRIDSDDLTMAFRQWGHWYVAIGQLKWYSDAYDGSRWT